MARPVKRAYDSSRRQAQARATQGEIALAARDLFVERGYNATSVRDIADRAGVSVQTIYNLFAGKPAILDRAADIAVVGDDEPVALADRPDIEQLMQATDPVELLERWIGVAVGIFSRFLPLLPAIREGAASDPAIAQMWRVNAGENRYEGTRATMQRLDELGALRAGLAVTEAADITWTVLSFDSYEALIDVRGWTPEAYAAWALATLRATILAE